MAFVWNLETKSCWLLPRLLLSSEMQPGPCVYFVDKRCQPQSSCPSDFVTCLRDVPEKRFLFVLQQRNWQRHNDNCVSRGGQLAEFPGHFSAAMRSFFPMFKVALLQNFIDVSRCNVFSNDNVQCQAYIGAYLQSNEYKWVRHGSVLEANWSLPFPVHPLYERKQTDAICFSLKPPNINVMLPVTFTVKDQVPGNSQFGLCECLL